MSNKNNNININASIDTKELKKGLNEASKLIIDFANEAGKSLTGIDFSKFFVPASVAGASVEALTKLKKALDGMAELWRQQEKAEVALENAAKNNPYLNDRAVNQLKKFANEMQNLSGIDNVLIMQQQTYLANMGRSQDQIQKIISTASDMAAAGLSSFDNAVYELNISLNGMTGNTLGTVTGIKGLTKEAMAAGDAIELMAQKVSGQAEQAMKTSSGSVQAYKNALGNLKKIYGEDWERVTKGLRNTLTNYIEKVVASKEATREWKKAVEELKEDSSNITASIIVRENELIELQHRLESLVNVYEYTYRDLNEDVLLELDLQTKRNTESQIESFKVQIENQIRWIEALKERQDVEEAVAIAVERANKAAETGSIIALEAAEKTISMQKELANTTHRTAIQILKERAEAAAVEAEVAAKMHQEKLNAESEAIRIRQEIEASLALEEERIIRKAKLEGKINNDAKENSEVQNQLINARYAAYEKLLQAAQEHLALAPEEQRNADEWKKKLEEEFIEQRKLVDVEKEKEEIRGRVQKLQQEVSNETTRINELVREAVFQEELSIISEKALVERIKFEAEYRRKQREEILEDQLKVLEEAHREGIISTEEYHNEKMQLAQNYATLEIMIEKDKMIKIEQAQKEMFQNMLTSIDNILNKTKEITGKISSAWTELIDSNMEKKIEENKNSIECDEERAAEEDKIRKKAAYERYRAEMVGWAANVILANAQGAMMVIRGFLDGGWPGAIAAAAMATIQLATVISAKPNAPSFHQGGMIQGASNREVPFIGLGKEYVLTNNQFKNAMKNNAELASLKNNGGGINLNINVKNNAANIASVNQQITPEGLEITIEKIVSKGLGDGTFDQSLAAQGYNLQGVSIT